MKYFHFVFFLSCCLLVGCADKTTNSKGENEATNELDAQVANSATSTQGPEQEATANADTYPDAAPADAQAQSAVNGPDFPKDQRVEFTEEMLNGLCTSRYSCLEEVIYPLGWSEDSKFAYLLEATNEAVYNYTLHFIIQDTKTDKQLVKETFKASEQPRYEPDDATIDVDRVWSSRKDRYNELLTQHQIRTGNGTQFYGMPWVKSQRPYRFKAINKMAHSDLFDLDFVSEHRLEASEQGAGKKIILTHTFGKYDLALATQALGYFQSPFEDRIAVVDAYEKRGYEGPPNVLKLMLVGCDLSQWD